MARSARSLPTAAAAALSAPVLSASRNPLSRLDAAAGVRPDGSSITWAWMCRDERNTESRGRLVAVRAMRWRTRAWRRPNRVFDLLLILPPLLLLAFLAPDLFRRVFDALAFVRLRLAIAANHRRHLADPLAVRAGDRDRRPPLADDLHVVRDRQGDVVAVV